MLVVERVSFSLLVVLFVVCKSSVATGSHQQQQEKLVAQGLSEDEQRRENEARDLMRYLFLVFRNNYPVMNHYGRGTLGIPFRPVRRMGSEFLGKRSENPFLEKSQFNELSEEKRALGSEFLGKRRLGSEFLGKRGDDSYRLNGLDDDMSSDKRALGSEFLGKRRPSLWDWSWKRGLGSEFLGKRVLGSEFLGKRGGGQEIQQEVVGPEPLELVPSESAGSPSSSSRI